jgi:uncharacterized protein YqeY
MPTLKERIDSDIKEAMRKKDELETNVLRMLKSAVRYKEVEPGGKALDDAGVLGVIQTLVKQYLPRQISAAELDAEVQAAVTQVGAKGPRDMGAVMKILLPKLAGRAEGKVVSEAVKGALAKL